MRKGSRHVTTHIVTIASGDLVDGSNARDFARDWQAVRGDGDIQFAPVEVPKPPEQAEWLRAVLEFLGKVLEAIGEFLGSIGSALGLSVNAVMWILAALCIALVALLIWRMFAPAARLRRQTEAAEEGWTPDPVAAIGLLEDADRLAAQGRFDEATHLLLQRSVFQIRQAQPGLLDPSSTAREISAMTALPDAARRAFGVIAERVERNLFALRGLTSDDWQAARAAYANFALAAPQAAT